MAKVHPKTPVFTSTSDQYLSSQKETFTVWMKSLVINGNGCSVFNSKGDVVFRVDNYQTKHSREILLMNLNGDVVFSIKRKKLLGFGNSWEGHRWINSKFHEEGGCFKVKKVGKFFGNVISCHVDLGCNNPTSSCYRIEGFQGKSTLKITDCSGRVLAEVMKKQSSTGVSLGNDVLSLVVEPQIDQSLIMALVIVYGMINNKL